MILLKIILKTQNMDHKTSSVDHETENSVGSFDDDQRSSQPLFSVCESHATCGDAEDVSTMMGPHSSDLDEVVLARSIISKQLSCEDDAPESVFGKNGNIITRGRIYQAPKMKAIRTE